jgi:uncharacterized protein (TIGR00290 family)
MERPPAEAGRQLRDAARAWVAWSSGKDSLWALHAARQTPELEVVGLLTTVTEAYARVSMHGVREALLCAQADVLGLPLHRVLIPTPCPSDTYEDLMRRALDEAASDGVTQIVHGDVHLADVRDHRERQLAKVGMGAVFPLWGRDTRDLAEAMVEARVEAYITCIDLRRAPRWLAGQRFDRRLLERLPEGIDPCGENGEFHTFVCDGPGYARPIAVTLGETVEREGFVFTDLIPDGEVPAHQD